MLKPQINGNTASIQQNAGFPALDINPAPSTAFKNLEGIRISVAQAWFWTKVRNLL